MGRTRYYLRQTWNNVIRSQRTVLQTLLMMSIALLLLGLFAWLSNQTRNILHRWEGDAPILLFLKDDLKDTQRTKLALALRKRKEISHAIIVSPEHALKRLS